ISFVVNSAGGITANDLATALATASNNVIKTTTSSSTVTQNATVSAIDVSAAPAVATTYTFTSGAAGQVTLTRASDGATQTMALADTAAGGSQTLNWNTLGVALTINSAGGIKASALATALSTAPNNWFKTLTSNDTASVTSVNV